MGIGNFIRNVQSSFETILASTSEPQPMLFKQTIWADNNLRDKFLSSDAADRQKIIGDQEALLQEFTTDYDDSE